MWIFNTKSASCFSQTPRVTPWRSEVADTINDKQPSIISKKKSLSNLSTAAESYLTLFRCPNRRSVLLLWTTAYWNFRTLITLNYNLIKYGRPLRLEMAISSYADESLAKSASNAYVQTCLFLNDVNRKTQWSLFIKTEMKLSPWRRQGWQRVWKSEK